MFGVIIWLIIFIAAIILLVKSADWFVESAEKVGIALKISPFIVGIIIVAVGTSFPELISSLFAVFKGATEMVVANVLGSNIANILLVIGLSAIVSGQLAVKRSLIDLDASFLAGVTALFYFIIRDGKVVFGEGILLLAGFGVYVLYTIYQRREVEGASKGILNLVEVLPGRDDRRKKEMRKKGKGLDRKIILFLLLGAGGMTLGANYTVEALLKLSQSLHIATSLITITALAIGTSLPELVVSVRTAYKKKYEIALGNIFGSNIFNILLVAGVPAIIKPLKVDNLTLSVGMPFFLVATLLFIFSSISRKIHIWEGAMYVLIYILFLVKVTGLF